MQHIILIGFMGSGKSTIGRQVARECHCNFYDTDQMIEMKQNCSIANLFETKGETYFRALETDMVRNLMEQKKYGIISVGGGLPIQEGNGELLRQLGYVIYLKAKEETIVGRLAGDVKRPLIVGEDRELKVHSLLTWREPIYESVAHETIETDEKSICELVKYISNRFDKHKKGGNIR